MRPLITISVPVFNEEENIRPLLARLRAVAGTLSERYEFEFLFTDNDSDDKTLSILAQEVVSDPRVRILKLSRNFGFQRSILTNFLNARGVAAIQIDADLQDPPEMFADFLDRWEKGYKVVFGVRKTRTENALLLAGRKLFYRFIDRITEFPVPVDAGDFRLIDRVIIEQLRGVNDRNPYLRGLIASFGYPQIGIPYSRSVRTAGQSKFTLLKLFKLGVDGVTSQSTKPLQFITLAGFTMCFMSLLGVVVYGIMWGMGYGRQSPGFTTLVLLQLIGISVNALLLGVIGEYLARVFDNVRGHPMSLVEREISHASVLQDETAGKPVVKEKRV